MDDFDIDNMHETFIIEAFKIESKLINIINESDWNEKNFILYTYHSRMKIELLIKIINWFLGDVSFKDSENEKYDYKSSIIKKITQKRKEIEKEFNIWDALYLKKLYFKKEKDTLNFKERWKEIQKIMHPPKMIDLLKKTTDEYHSLWERIIDNKKVLDNELSSIFTKNILPNLYWIKRKYEDIEYSTKKHLYVVYEYQGKKQKNLNWRNVSICFKNPKIFEEDKSQLSLQYTDFNEEYCILCSAYFLNTYALFCTNNNFLEHPFPRTIYWFF